MSLPRLRLLVALLFLMFLSSAVAAQAAGGSVRGTVRTPEDAAVADAKVTLVELKRATRTDDEGAFRFDGIPAGIYLIEVLSARFGSAIGQVRVAEGQEAVISLRADLAVHHEDVVVSAGVSPQSVSDVAQAVTVLDGSQLTSKVEPTIGETLGAEPGVSQTFYAPGASRPVIRGLGGDRIRVLQDGIGAGDASNVSPDHAVSVNPYAAERVEIVRGAASLLYGSNAIGGVVNVLDNRIPDHRGDEALAGDVQLRYGSNSDLRTGAANLGGTIGALGWHVDGAATETDDYAAGGDFGVKDNSDLESQSVSGGASWLGEKAYVGGAFNRFDTNYGSAVEDEVRIDLVQERWDLRGGINAPFGAFRSLKARFGRTDYEHVELEGAEVGTRFRNESLEGRIELAHRQAGAWLGSFGVQGWARDFEAIGEEAFVQPNQTDAFALFAFEEIGTGALKGQLGARYENQQVDSADPTLRERSFDAPSASAGLTGKAGETWALGSTLSWSSRVPTAEELFANGPHIATATFEVGDDDLDLEESLGLDLTLRKLEGTVSGEVSLFYTDFDAFIFERDTGSTFVTDEGDVLPIIQFSQSEARFWGGEAHLDFALIHAEPHHLDLELRGDIVRAELTELDEPVPLQPPARAAIGLRYQGSAFWAQVEGFRAFEQERFGAFDTATPAYTFLKAAVGYRLLASGLAHDLVLRGANLTDRLAFNSISRFREVVPLPGREVSLAYRLLF